MVDKQMTNKSRTGHSALAAVITAAVLIAVLLLNLLFTLISSKHTFYLDSTKESFYEISELSREYLEELKPEENDITIYFMITPDRLNAAGSMYGHTSGEDSNIWGMRQIYELAKLIASKYSFVNIDFIDKDKEPERLKQITKQAYNTTTASLLDVIIVNYSTARDDDGNIIYDINGNEIKNHNYRICKRDAFYVFDTDSKQVFQFKGDALFTSTILSLSGNNPIAYFVTGHGEKVGGLDSGDFGSAASLVALFSDAGFEARKIDLQKEELDDDDARVVVLYGPTSDYVGSLGTDAGKVNEIKKLHDFVTLENHHMMVFMDPERAEMPNLDEFLYDFYGLTFNRDLVVDKGGNSLTPDGMTVVADYVTEQNSIGHNLTAGLSNLDSAPSVVFPNAGTITIDGEFGASDGFYEYNSVTVSGPSFVTPGSAFSKDLATEAETSLEKDPRALLALSYEMWWTGDNKEVPTYVLSCATTGFASEDMLSGSAYANRDVLFLAMRLMGKENVPFDIDHKVIEDTESLDIEAAEGRGWFIVTTVVMPVIVAAAGTVIIVKRRRNYK